VQDKPASVTVKVLPPIVSVPLRADVDVFAIAEKPTVPFADPGVPDVTESQPILLELAVHAQPVGAVTLTVPLPPAAGSDWLVVESVAHEPAGGSVTVKVVPAIVNVPLRVDVVVFAVAEKPTVPLPDPGVPEVTESHVVLLELAVHAQPASAVTATLPVPPPAGSD
jgi:hypothetical protein